MTQVDTDRRRAVEDSPNLKANQLILILLL